MGTEDILILTNPRQFESREIVAVYNSVNFTLSDSLVLHGNFHAVMYPAGVYGFFASYQDKLVGAMRVFSDDLMTAWVADICVHSEWRNQRVGTSMMQVALERFSHTSIYLEALNGSEAFFARFGIKPRRQLVACSKAATA